MECNTSINRANMTPHLLAKSCGYFVIIMVMNQLCSLLIPGSIPGAKTFHRRNPAFFSPSIPSYRLFSSAFAACFAWLAHFLLKTIIAINYCPPLSFLFSPYFLASNKLDTWKAITQTINRWNFTARESTIKKDKMTQQLLAKSCGYFVIIMVMNQSPYWNIPGSIPGTKTFHRYNPAFFHLWIHVLKLF